MFYLLVCNMDRKYYKLQKNKFPLETNDAVSDYPWSAILIKFVKYFHLDLSILHERWSGIRFCCWIHSYRLYSKGEVITKYWKF